MTAPAFDGIAGCDAEPIHVPGAVQPHGALLVLREPQLQVLQHSDNLQALLGLAAPAPDSPLASLLGAPIADAVRAALPALDGSSRPRRAGRFEAGGRFCDVMVHRHDGVLIVELEPAVADLESDFWPVYERMRAFIGRLRDAATVEAMCALAAREVRQMTGFGHTMVYAFDAEGHGHVLAEDGEPGYERYLGHRFPASDIPRQARELYRRNHIRLIPNADYAPARLRPALHPDHGGPTDLSFAALRSVSPVHLEYMRNMGTQASMSASLIVNGELWGLISCHDARPRHLPYALRTAFEHLGDVLSLQIEGHEDRQEIDHRLQLRAQLVAMLAAMGRTDGTLEHLIAMPELLGFGDASGSAVVVDGRCAATGRAPPPEAVLALVDWLADQGDDVFATDCLGEHYAPARGWADCAAGVMAIAVSKLHRNFVLWFRGEVVQTLQWAGNPHLAKQAAADGRLHPRTSFATWQEQLRGRSSPWRHSELDIAGEFRNALLGIVLQRAEELAQMARELARSNAELEAFSYSVSHDLRAPLRHIAGYADLVEGGERDALSERGRRFLRNIKESAGFAGSLVDGLLSFSRIGRTGLKRVRVPLSELVDAVIRTSALGARHEVEWQVEALPVVHADPVLLRVAIENLVGNALKYSATRAPARIAIRAVDDGEQHGLAVSDNGVGFDMKYVGKLFGVFQRLHSMDDYEGTGIGLANVRRVAERHGGAVRARGEVDRGATFTFTLPKAADPSPEIQQ